MVLRGIKPENIGQDLQDIAGLRIMVQFVDDVDEVLALQGAASGMKTAAKLIAGDMADAIDSRCGD